MWEVNQTFVTPDHEGIFEQTQHIPGWQDPGDSWKLYEMGYNAGDVILEIGIWGGRSTVVELQGALARTPPPAQAPQYYGVDISLDSIWRTQNTLDQHRLSPYALLYHGDLSQFLAAFAIQPTMVFLDGDHTHAGVKQDLQLLARAIAPGTPVLCHDYSNPRNKTGEYGVDTAVNEFVAAGYATMIGEFGCSALLKMSDACQGQSGSKLSDLEFAQHKVANLEAAGLALYNALQASNAAQTTHREEINQLHTYLEDLKAQRQQAEVNHQQQQQATQQVLTAAQNRLNAMETSKFWQLRSRWFQVKRLLGLGQNE